MVVLFQIRRCYMMYFNTISDDTCCYVPETTAGTLIYENDKKGDEENIII